MTATVKVKKNKTSRKVSSRLRLILRRKKIHKSNAPRRKKPWLASKSRSEKSIIIKVTAPISLNIHQDKEAPKTIDFIQNLKKAVKKASNQPERYKVMVCFEQSNKINASGAVYLYAQLNRLTMRHPAVRFVIQRPKVTSKPEKVKSMLDEVLNHLGIYKLMGLNWLPLTEGPSVKCWHVFSSDKVDMESIVTSILEYTLHGHSKMDDEIYRGLSEAISNAAEHAYSENIESDADLSVKKYWFLSAVYDNELYLMVCDLGHGIPYTLGRTETTKDKNFLSKVYSFVRNEDTESKREIMPDANHANMIHAATLVKQTTTKLNYRGKGGTDLRRIVDDCKGAEMTIISRKGRYDYGSTSKRTPSKKERKVSIDGTVVGWSIPLTGEQK